MLEVVNLTPLSPVKVSGKVKRLHSYIAPNKLGGPNISSSYTLIEITVHVKVAGISCEKVRNKPQYDTSLPCHPL